MARFLSTAAVYFCLGFGAGFVFGPVRVFWLEPRVGGRVAVLIESPFMLAAIVAAGVWVGRRWLAGRSVAARLGVGLLAAGAVLAADVAVGLGVRGLSFAEVFTGRDPVSGAVYYGLVGLFAMMPWLAGIHRVWGTTKPAELPSAAAGPLTSRLD